MTSSDGDRVRDASVGRGITRHWCQRDASVSLDEGYLADLDAFGMRSPALRTIDQLAELQVVVLLGEWGLGKTTTLNGYEQRAGADAGEDVVWFDLGDYGSDSLLVTEVFGDPRLERWRDGDGELRLLLDSLDECKAHIPNLAGLLASRLRRSPVERLRLMIVCRTADWPLSLEAALRDIFGEVGVYELLPLQRDDVRTIAEQAGIDGGGFLAAVEHSGVTALASRPLTLQLLLRR
jgi:hypothetical protein